MKRIKIIHWIFFAMFALSILGGAATYVINYQQAIVDFAALNFPAFIIIPLAIAKVTGIVAILLSKNQTIKEWAYAGFTFNLLLATGSHLAVQDGEWYAPVMVLAFMIGAYLTYKKLKHELRSNREY